MCFVDSAVTDTSRLKNNSTEKAICFSIQSYAPENGSRLTRFNILQGWTKYTTTFLDYHLFFPDYQLLPTENNKICTLQAYFIIL